MIVNITVDIHSFTVGRLVRMGPSRLILPCWFLHSLLQTQSGSCVLQDTASLVSAGVIKPTLVIGIEVSYPDYIPNPCDSQAIDKHGGATVELRLYSAGDPGLILILSVQGFACSPHWFSPGVPISSHSPKTCEFVG